MAKGSGSGGNDSRPGGDKICPHVPAGQRGARRSGGLRPLLAVCVLAATPAVAAADEQADRRQATLRTVSEILEAVKAIEYGPQSGRGSAVVKVRDGGLVGAPEPILREHIFDFRFKGTSSRSDQYSMNDGRKGEREVAWTDSADRCLTLNDRYLTIASMPTAGFHRTWGRDFHPQSFFTVNNRPLSFLLDGIRRHLEEKTGTAEVAVDDKGIVNLTFHYGDPGGKAYYGTVRMALDAAHGFRLLRCETDDKNQRRPGSFSRETYRIQWRDYGTTGYPERITVQSAGKGRLPTSGDPDAEWKLTSYSHRAEVVITQFEPDADVSDKEFTVKGLNVRPGTKVRDKIAGLYYVYGGRSPDPLTLERVLDETSLPSRVLPLTSDAARSGVEPRGDSGQIPARHEKGPTAPALRSQTSWLWVVPGALALVALGLFAWLFWRRRGSPA